MCSYYLTTVDYMNDDWFLGFLEGEGLFTINFTSRYRFIYPRLIFAICITERDVLASIANFLLSKNIKSGLYHFKYHWKNLKNKPKIRKEQWYLVVQKRESILKMIPMLEKLEWHTNKYHTFQIWKDSVNLVYKRPCTKKNLIEISRMACQFKSTKGPERKWTPEFIETNCIQLEDGRTRLVQDGADNRFN